ncbi:MAG: hypothetical protein O2880_14595 [Proteobacteria bacterium]|nr:hypothetical protein [Pseudomonadota bacterium]
MVRGLLLLALLPYSVSAEQQVLYTVSLQDRSKHFYDVTMAFDAPRDSSTVQVSMSRWSTGGSQIGDFARYVKGFEARDSDGNLFATRKVDLHTWQVDTMNSDHVSIHYRVFAESPSRIYASDISEDGAFLDPGASLMYVQSMKGRPTSHAIAIQLTNVPSGWTAATGLTAGPRPFSYTTSNYDRLIESPVLVGTLLTDNFQEGSARITVAIAPAEPDLEVDALIENVRKIVRSFSDMFGGLPFSNYTFLYRLPNRPGSSAMERWNSTTIQLPYSRVMRSREDFNDLTSHQFFHAWNTMRIRQAIRFEPNYSEAVLTKSLWFSEGTTRYYAKLGRMRAGLLSENDFLAAQASEILLHQSRPARLTQSLEDASWNAPFTVDLWYRSRSNSIEYGNKGALVSFLLDLAIRDATGGRRSLDDVMRLMNERFGETGIGYEETDDILAAVNSVSGQDMTWFFDDYIRGTTEIDYERLVEPAGLEVVEIRRSNLDPGFWAERAYGVPVMVVTAVTTGSSADEGGVEVGDAFVGLDNTDIDAGLETYLAKFETGDTVTARFRRGLEDYSP